jgi:hypothetical protein
MKQLLAALLMWAALPAQAQVANTSVANNPGYDRPGLGFTPAVLQAGDVIWEQGLPDGSRADGVSQYNADALLRLGLGHALEVQVGTGWSRQTGAGARIDGRADTTLALKFAPAASGKLSWGLLGMVELTDGAPAFRAAQRQYLLGASFNWQRSPSHALGLYVQAVQGDAGSQLVAINDGWALSPVLSGYVELAAQHAAGTGYGSLGGAGLAWQVTPRLQVDVGLRHRLGGHADDWQGGAGIAFYFGD